MAGDVGPNIGAGVGAGEELSGGPGVELGLGDGLLLGVGVGVGLGVRVGVGDGEGVGEVGDGVGLGLGLGDADDWLGLGDADDVLGLGDGLTDPAAKAVAHDATAPARRSPRRVTPSVRAMRRWLAAADPGRRNLALEIVGLPGDHHTEPSALRTS